MISIQIDATSILTTSKVTDTSTLHCRDVWRYAQNLRTETSMGTLTARPPAETISAFRQITTTNIDFFITLHIHTEAIWRIAANRNDLSNPCARIRSTKDAEIQGEIVVLRQSSQNGSLSTVFVGAYDRGSRDLLAMRLENWEKNC